LERVKGIEPSYSAWKGIAKRNDLKSGSEKYAAKIGRNSHSFRTRATAAARIRMGMEERNQRAKTTGAAGILVPRGDRALPRRL
jgi:hypothetical protein